MSEEHAIVAISVAHQVFLMATLPGCPDWVMSAIENDWLSEIEDHEPAGVYVVQFVEDFGCGIGGHIGECPGDCGDVMYEIIRRATFEDFKNLGD